MKLEEKKKETERLAHWRIVRIGLLRGQIALWDGDRVRLTGGEKWDARMWVSSEDWNLIA